MAKYRKKPVVIEAVKVVFAEMLAKGPEHSPFAEMPDWLREAIESGTVTLSTSGARDYAVIAIHTLEGEMEATPGDFIIRGVKGELYPCKPAPFHRCCQSKTRATSPASGTGPSARRRSPCQPRRPSSRI